MTEINSTDINATNSTVPRLKPLQLGAKTVALGGGVAANSLLRSTMTTVCAESGWRLVLPSMGMCTDNAAMIASAGWYRLVADGPSSMDMGAMPNLKLS